MRKEDFAAFAHLVHALEDASMLMKQAVDSKDTELLLKGRKTLISLSEQALQNL